MTNYYYTLLIVFAIIVAMMIIDQNVTIYINLMFKMFKLNTERFFWMLRFHPIWIENPIGRWWMMKKYERTIRELSEELSKTPDDVL